jgi:hypothetical protein
MARKLFIPKKCRVGFQYREGTFTKKLAYVIYYDAANKIRKEKSWRGWCHLPEDEEGGKAEYQYWDQDKREHVKTAGIEPFDFDNVPTDGFVLNKGIRRISWSHFGSGRSMCRIYDPRGIEFEITIENLVGLLMHTDCSKREIQGELVYAWCGGDLMLLPCNSEEYQAAKDFTSLQAKKVGARELKEGATYVTKSEEHLVYLGRHMWYEEKDRYGEQNRREGKKQHIFCDIEGKSFKPIKSVPSTIAAIETEHPHDNTANWIDAYQAHVNSSPIVEWIKEPIPESEWNQDWDAPGRNHWDRPQINCFMSLPGDLAHYAVTIQKYKKPEHQSRHHFRMHQEPQSVPDGALVWCRNRIIRPDGSSGYLNHGRSLSYGHEHGEGQVTDRTRFFNLKAKYENGHIQEWS